MEWTKEQVAVAKVGILGRFGLHAKVGDVAVILQLELTAALHENERLRSQLSKDDTQMGELAVGGWISVNQELPPISKWVLAWLYLPRNPPASGIVTAQYSGCENDESPDYRQFRKTVRCWWANGRYYEQGHVTHWQSFPAPPSGEQGAASYDYSYPPMGYAGDTPIRPTPVEVQSPKGEVK